MGVKGLLPQLREIQEGLTLERFRGKTLAIDSYAWLHRSVISCSWELAQDMETTKYLSFFKKKVMMLKHFGIEPYFVFDGDHFESKNDTEIEREQNRIRNKEKGLEMLQNGNRKLAGEFFMKSIDVTPSMAKSIIEYLKSENMKYVVAPYEADPQLVYLEKLGLVDGIISEDSDLLIFGAKCLLTKLNDFGECVEIRRENFKKCKAVPIGLMNESQLRMVACLSGCDYTNGIPGIGIVKAFRLVKRHSNISKCIMSLKLEGKTPVPAEFEMEYKKADVSFQYQRVFNPITNEISTLNEVPSQIDEILLLECIGKLHDNSIHHQIAMGELDPISKTPLKSREEIVRSKSFTVASTPVSKPLLAGSERVAKRSYSTPVTSGMQRIDSFFKTSQDRPNNRSTTVPSKTEAPQEFRVLTPKSLSPTSKRRRMFNSPIAYGHTPITSASKFFQTKKPIVQNPQVVPTANVSNFSKHNSNTVPNSVEPLEQQQLLESSPIVSKFSGKDPNNTTAIPDTVQNNNSILKDLNSSDFDLTDPDDNDDGPQLDHQDKPSCSNKPKDDLKSTVESEHKGTQLGTNHQKEVAQGLYERFGFNCFKSHHTKVNKVQVARYGKSEPLKPIQQNNNIDRPRTTTVKTKRSISKNLTLDTFIYRGS